MARGNLGQLKCDDCISGATLPSPRQRYSLDPVMRWIVGGKAVERQEAIGRLRRESKLNGGAI